MKLNIIEIVMEEENVKNNDRGFIVEQITQRIYILEDMLVRNRAWNAGIGTFFHPAEFCSLTGIEQELAELYKLRTNMTLNLLENMWNE